MLAHEKEGGGVGAFGVEKTAKPQQTAIACPKLLKTKTTINFYSFHILIVYDVDVKNRIVFQVY